MKKKGHLTVRQEELLNYLWDVNEPLTASTVAERLEPEGWNSVTIYKAMQSLDTLGYLKIAGLEHRGKTYARKLVPAVTKEEYYVKMLQDVGITASDLPALCTALISNHDKSDAENRESTIKVLQDIVDSLK